VNLSNDAPWWTASSRTSYDLSVRPTNASAGRTVGATTIRGALIAGFAVVFALWLLSGYELVRGLQEVERGVADAQEASTDAERTLSKVRTNVLVGSIYLRDALIDTGTVTREYYRDELRQIRNDIERLIPAYLAAITSPLERKHATDLQIALVEYWASLDIVFEANAPRSSVQGTGIVRRLVVPAREDVLKIVDTLATLQQLERQQHGVVVSLLYRDVRMRLLAIGALAIAVGVLVASFASAHVGRLQREIESQRLSEQQNRRDLERLSARLVSAQEEERRSLARELHDAVGQALTAIKMEMGVAMRGMESDSLGKAALDDARAIAESTLQNVRDLSQFLHPSTLDDFGLPDTVAAYLKGFSKRTGIRARLTIEGMDERLSVEHEVCVFRIVQEATTNVARHSGARSCAVALARAGATLRVTIEDDGRGIDTHASGAREPRRGLGLIGMRERAQALAGVLVIENRAEGGTRVRLTLPAIAETARLAG
jgi:signal transduction histidine kinase